MRRLLAVALIAAAPASVRADDDDGMTEPSSVQLSLAGTQVRVQARFRVEVDGPGVALGAAMLPLPPRAVVTSGVATVEGKRHALRLDRAEGVRRSFDALTVKPPGGERASALLLEHGGGSVATLDVLLPGTTKVVLDLALEAPTCFYNDVRYVELPASFARALPAAQRPLAKVDDKVMGACGRLQGDDDDSRWFGFASRELAKQPAGERRVGTIAGRLALDSVDIARVEIDLARELTAAPKDLVTVILIDHSRSLTPDELETQRAVAMAYVRAAPPTSRVQVIGYTRRAEPLLASWMVASHAPPQIDRAIRALAQRNGSNVDTALQEAARWLATVKGTKRVLLFSDARLAERIEAAPESLSGLVAADTLVHVVQPAPQLVGLERADDDESALAMLAKATQGISTFAALDDSGSIDATMLVRPISIDRLAIESDGWKRSETTFDTRDCTELLFEGNTCTWWGEGNGAAGPITISGLMWNKPFRRVVHADPSQARTIARVLSTMGIAGDLQEQVDRAALAVNQVWSLFAQWGGSGGYEDLGGIGRGGGGQFSTHSHDHVGGIGHGTAIPPLDLRAQLKPALDGCKVGKAIGWVSVETTLEEIVDVAVNVSPANPTLEACITEAVWDLTLRIPGAPRQTTTRVGFGAGPGV